MIVYVQRDAGLICGVYPRLQPGIAEEQIDDSSAEVVAFRSPPPDPRRVLDEQEAEAAKLDNQIMTFLNWTPTQLEAWLATNIDNAATLADIKAAVHTALSVLGRIAINAGRNRSLR